MKKVLSSIITLSLFLSIAPVFAEVVSSADQVVAPKWEDYVPDKYLNPNGSYTKKEATKQIILGGILTDLIITAPIGIPILVKGVTKMKNVSYYNRKQIFSKGLEEAQKIENPAERKAYYDNLLKQCRFTEEQKQKIAKKRAKNK